MADVSSHAPGSFSWAELATTDQASGVAFYSALFDWSVDESPVGPGETYSMFQLRGRPVAAAYKMRPDERQVARPPHWNMYVTAFAAVVSLDDSSVQQSAPGSLTTMAPTCVLGSHSVLYVALRMEGEGQLRGRADGVHRVLSRRASVHWNDADVRSRAPAGAVVLDAVLPGGGLRCELREGEAPRRRGHSGPAGHSAPDVSPY